MRFLIDDSSVNSRPDWRHQPKPGAASRMQFQTPGNSEVIVLAEPALPPDFVVTGFLQGFADSTAEALSVLDDQVRRWCKLKGDGLAHELTLANRKYKVCEVIDAGSQGPITACDGGVKIPFSFTFRMLRNDVETVEEEDP